MMAKMFYTLEETKTALQKNEEEIKQLSREGRLREFRDGPRLMFKADQVDNLKAELAGGGGDQISLGPSDSGVGLSLADSKASPLSGSGISLADTDFGKSPGAGMVKDDTALAAGGLQQIAINVIVDSPKVEAESLEWGYESARGFQPLTVTADTTQGLTANGRVELTPPTRWPKAKVDGQDSCWLAIRTLPSAAAKCPPCLLTVSMIKALSSSQTCASWFWSSFLRSEG